MRDDLAQLFLGQPVVERAFEMADQLLFAAERDQRGDDDQAAIALRELRALPDLAEQPLLGIVDQVRHGGAAGLAGRAGLGRLGHVFLRSKGLKAARTVARRRPPATRRCPKAAKLPPQAARESR